MKFYANPDYPYSYAVVNLTRGEVYTYSAVSSRIALKNTLKRFDRILREAKSDGYDVSLKLYNCNNGTLVAEDSYTVPLFVKKWGFKSESQLMATIGAIYDEYETDPS